MGASLSKSSWMGHVDILLIHEVVGSSLHFCGYSTWKYVLGQGMEYLLRCGWWLKFQPTITTAISKSLIGISYKSFYGRGAYNKQAPSFCPFCTQRPPHRTVFVLNSCPYLLKWTNFAPFWPWWLHGYAFPSGKRVQEKKHGRKVVWMRVLFYPLNVPVVRTLAPYRQKK